MYAIALDETEIAELADKLGDACDGQHAVTILVAVSDLFYAIVDSHPGLSMDNIMSDFVGLTAQRHGQNTSQAIN